MKNIFKIAFEENKEETIPSVPVVEESLPVVPVEETPVVIPEDKPTETPVEETVPVVLELDESISESDNEENDIKQEIDDIEDGDNILNTTTNIENNLEAVVKDEDGLDKASTEITTSALEHFYQKFNFKSKKVINVSNESFATKENRLDTTKIVFENLKVFNTRLDKQLTIAKEGIGKRFANSIKMIFTAEKSIITKVTEGLNKAKESGVKDSIIINEPGWGRSFAMIDSKTISGSDVIKYLSTLDKLFKNDMIKYIEEINTLLIRVTTELKRGTSKESIEKAYKELINVVQDIEKFDKKFQDNYGSLKTKKADPNFKTLTSSEINTLGNLTLSILKDEKIEKDFNEFFNMTWNNFSDIWYHSQYRADLATSMADSSSTRIADVVESFWDMLAERKRICFAASNYIKASLK